MFRRKRRAWLLGCVALLNVACSYGGVLEQGEQMNRDRVLAAWDELWSQMGREIMKGSGTLDVLVPLAKHEEAALAIVRRESRSDDFARRKVAAMLAGYLEGLLRICLASCSSWNVSGTRASIRRALIDSSRSPSSRTS
jgi:hypothetical protein